MTIEITWVKIILAFLFLILLLGGWVLFRPNWGNRDWVAVQQGKIVAQTGKYRPPFWQRLNFWVCYGLKYVPEKREW